MARPDIPSAKWVGLPRSWTSGRKTGQPSVVFIHTTDGSEGRQSAENGAAYDKTRIDGTSTHLFVDQDSIVQEVEFKDEAHTARAHGNDVGIQIEVCGLAKQTVAQWDDEASRGTIDQLIVACVEIRELYGPDRFPLVNLTPAQLKAGKPGFAEHYDATLAWPEDKGDHTDPGPNFPWDRLFDGIKEAEAAAMALTPAEIAAIAKATTTSVKDLLEKDLRTVALQKARPWQYQDLDQPSAHKILIDEDGELRGGLRSIDTKLTGLGVQLAAVPDAVLAKLGATHTPTEVAALLRQIPGFDWDAIGAALTP